ncbi:diacylglycerol kinase (ATP) [Allocatelliglobosispora scoriae]|uniref:Diacylglycerol kinase (ATP) n=1 Tax=Allocatelliglobosispora scoriae TaxID=643052 RepID=A0A841C4H5_9ACTN|nr:diacylglycerol kinase [Allocatelliglobosispora scoriae]MBB5873870.1 diacylglycerol kinase (ATP) [Allocatelliglobosispora scoriae]
MIAVLVNPTAGRGRHRGVLTEVVERLRGAGEQVVQIAGESAEQAQQGCRDAVADGARALVAIGGDGTLHLALQAVAERGIPLGIIPAGTGNDVATAVGVPADPLAAADLIVAALLADRTTTIDLARIDGAGGETRWFAGVLGLGFDAIVNERANRMRFPKGSSRYDVAIVLELARLKARRYAITVDGVRHDQDAVLVAIGNTPSYGGGMRICPAAVPTDGLSDLVIAGPVSRATLMRVKPRIYAGTHVSHPAVRQLRGKVITIDAEGITGYADGERALPLPITVTAVPGALTLLR